MVEGQWVNFVGSASMVKNLYRSTISHITTTSIVSSGPRLHDGQPTQQQQLTDSVVTAHATDIRVK
jgi:hypothetical protein